MLKKLKNCSKLATINHFNLFHTNPYPDFLSRFVIINQLKFWRLLWREYCFG